jgi:hypothetical protein
LSPTPSGFDRGYVGDREVELRRFFADVRFDRDDAVRLQGRFRAGLDLHDRPHIGAAARFDLGIPDKQSLPVWIGFVDLDAPGAARSVGNLRSKEFQKRPLGGDTARIADRIDLAPRFFFDRASSSSIDAASSRSSRKTVTSMSSEKHRIKP